AGCDINLAAATPYTLNAAATGLGTATSTGITVSVGTALGISFATQPSPTATGGVNFAAQPAVAFRDAGGNTVTTMTDAVTLSLTTPAGASLGCTNNTVSGVAGVASFVGCDIDLASATPYTLFAQSGSINATSNGVTVSVGPASQLAFTTQPSPTATGGVNFAVQPAVSALDAGGNTVVDDPTSVTLSITTPAGATLGCTNNGPLAFVTGVATFAGCDINLAGATPYTLHAVDGALAPATSTGITVSVGTPTQLAFTTQPSATVTGGTDFAAQPVVTIRDAGGNTVTTDTTGVILTITTPAGAALGCTPNNGPHAAVAGVATFAGCDIDLASGTPYTLHAADGGLAAATSTGITVSVGTASRLAFTTQPSAAATGGTNFAAQPVATIQDAGGNTVSGNTSGVTLSITTPAGALLGCTPNNGPLAATAGIATFVGCDINLASATPYTLRAVDGALAAATSAGITVSVGTATQLAFATQPSPTATGGTNFAVQPTVAVRDAGGNTVTTDTSGVTLTITTPAGALLGCTNNGPVAAAAGIAAFTGCDIDKASATPYTLHATAAGVVGVTSTAITVSVGTASRLGFVTQPSTTATGGTDFAQQPAVAIQDAGGNTITGNVSGVSLSITTPAGAALSCSPNNGPRAAVAGVATFVGCDINLSSGTPYTLRAIDGGFTAATSTGITVSTGAAVQLAFATQPSATATGGIDFAQQPVVAITDAGGNTVNNASGVTLSITTPAGATLGCTNNGPLNATAGIATFAGCDIDLASATPYTLHAADGILNTASSSAITISVGPATQLGFTQSPSTGISDTAFEQQPVVAVQDAGGNTVTATNTGAVTLTVTDHVPTSNLTCTGSTLTVAVVDGVANFTGCSMDFTGTGFTLTAADGGLTGTSTAFDITPGAAVAMQFSAQPTTFTLAGANFATQPIVQVIDAAGNVVTTDNTTVVALDLTRPSDPAGALLICDSNSFAVVDGVAAFSGCHVDTASTTTYTLSASMAGALDAVSNTFVIGQIA
ncbi:MAG: trimeric autotransporter adhesin, partial [Actinomycetota bacterium]|nr:trimeric autotransporter adhesin [Actinomycetota bacterium]